MEILPFRPISARRASTFARFGGEVGLARPFKELPWPKTRGIRLLIGTMRVGVLPAAPLNCNCQVV